MRRSFVFLLVSLVVLVFAGYSMAGSPASSPFSRPPHINGPKIPHHGQPFDPGHLIPPPSIKSGLRWDLVRYEGPYARKAIVRITAFFRNVGKRAARCPDAPCRGVLRRYEEGGSPPSSVEVLGYENISTLVPGQAITITKNVRVYCSREFTDIFEAFHDVHVKCPKCYSYHDPDYLRPSNIENVYDDNLNDNTKQIRERDIMNALWGRGCKPRR